MNKKSPYLKQTEPCSTLNGLRQKELQAYSALSALVDLLNDNTKPMHTYKSTMDFSEYKRDVLILASKIKLCSDIAINAHENQFNLMHYQHAILSASKENYRNMAILAAKHTLSKSALQRLVKQIKKKCLRLSKEADMAEQNQTTTSLRLPRNSALTNAVVIEA